MALSWYAIDAVIPMNGVNRVNGVMDAAGAALAGPGRSLRPARRFVFAACRIHLNSAVVPAVTSNQNRG
jgi:hypothetical protein